MKIGTFVQLRVPKSRRKDQFAYGIVTATEVYTTSAGSTEYIYVRWVDAVGQPQSDTIRHWNYELMELTETCPPTSA